MICLYFWFLYILFQFISVAQSWPTLWDTMDCSTSGFQHQLLELLRLMSIQSVMPPNYLMLCYPLLLLPPIFPSIRVYSNELVLHLGWPKYWSFIFCISPLINIQYVCPLGLTGLMSFQFNGLSRVFSNTKYKSVNSSVLSFLYSLTLTSIYASWKNHMFA